MLYLTLSFTFQGTPRGNVMPFLSWFLCGWQLELFVVPVILDKLTMQTGTPKLLKATDESWEEWGREALMRL